MSWCSGGIHPFLARINAPPRVCDVPGTEDSVKRLATANLMELFKIADDLLAGREFFFDHFTAPDAHFFWCQRRARQFELDLDQFKNCTAHFDRMLQRPSVQKLLCVREVGAGRVRQGGVVFFICGCCCGCCGSRLCALSPCGRGPTCIGDTINWVRGGDLSMVRTPHPTLALAIDCVALSRKGRGRIERRRGEHSLR